LGIPEQRDEKAVCIQTSLMSLTASRTLPSFRAHIANLLFMYTRTFVSRPEKTNKFTCCLLEKY